MNVMGCRFIYKTKRHPKTREVKKRKARLVCQGFKQIKGVDYDKTFASQARFSSIRLLLFLVNMYDLDMFSFDIKTFFLYGELDEDVYMEQPPGYQTKGNDWVWHLFKSLYGCKQSPRQAGKKLRQVLLDWLFKLNKSDPNFYFVMKNDAVLLLANFVDDTLCGVSKNSTLKEDFLAYLRSHFEIEVTDDPSEFLGFELVRDRSNRKMKIQQSGYAHCNC
jgi:hypothetical protein